MSLQLNYLHLQQQTVPKGYYCIYLRWFILLSMLFSQVTIPYQTYISMVGGAQGVLIRKTKNFVGILFFAHTIWMLPIGGGCFEISENLREFCFSDDFPIFHICFLRKKNTCFFFQKTLRGEGVSLPLPPMEMYQTVC